MNSLNFISLNIVDPVIRRRYGKYHKSKVLITLIVLVIFRIMRVGIATVIIA
jgi:hypothetical protein